MDVLRSLFHHELEYDSESLYVFEVGDNIRLSLIAGRTELWLQLTFAILIQAIITVVTSIVAYRAIVLKRGSMSSYLVGYSLIPIACTVPFRLIESLRIQNMAVMITLSGIPVIVVYQIFSAMYGTNPSYAEKSMKSYLLYVAPIIPLRFCTASGQVMSATTSEMRSSATSLVTIALVTTVAYSLMVPYNYQPFPYPPRQLYSHPDSWWQFFHWGHIANNYAVALVTSLSLTGGTTAFSLLTNIFTGKSTIQVMDYPLFCSQSVSDFWGRRWNRMAHNIIKNGIYKPFRKFGYSPAWASLAAFASSGLMHEYVLQIIALKHKDDGSSNVPGNKSGSHMLFFVWNGIVLLCEYALRGNKVASSIHLPRPMQTFLVLMTVLPLSYMFTDEYIVSGFFSDYAVGFPRLVRIQ